MRIAICDSNREEREQLIDALHGWNLTGAPECFAVGAKFLEAAQRKPAFDIVFLDTYMPGEDGMEIAREMGRISPDTGIVFVTASREYAVDAFSLCALHYLVKPVTAEGVEEAGRRLTHRHSSKRPMLTLSVGHASQTVYLDEVCYVQSVNHVKEIHLTEGRLLRVWIPLNQLEPKLNSNFLKLNRGTVVNMEQIEQMGVSTCILRDGTRLELPRRARTALRDAYDHFLLHRLSG